MLNCIGGFFICKTVLDRYQGRQAEASNRISNKEYSMTEDQLHQVGMIAADCAYQVIRQEHYNTSVVLKPDEIGKSIRSAYEAAIKDNVASV